MTYYIDPGTSKGCAVARSYDRKLIGLGIFDASKARKVWGVFGDHEPAVWEKPQFYPNTLKNLRPNQIVALANDLIDLTDAGRATAQALAGPYSCTSRRPREWKGQVPKPIHHGRVLRALQDDELELLATAYGKPPNALLKYVHDNAIKVGKGKPGAYKAEITDLLDAVALMLTEEGRL